MIAIDLGSNSLRCIEFDEKTKTFGSECEYSVKTADNLHKSGRISEDALKRIIAAINDAKTKLNFNTKIVALTTEAMRQAANSEEIIKSIEEKTGVHFQIISAEDEAKFTLRAVKNRLELLNIQSDSFILIDVGGGSTEIIFYIEGEIISQSFPLGIVTTTQACKNSENINTYLDNKMQKIQEFVDGLYAQKSKVACMVATAGTPTTMAAYLNHMHYSNYDAKKINGYHLTLEGIQKAFNNMINMSAKEREYYVGVGREDLILSGIVIVQKLYKILGFDEAIVIDDGLREGIALNT